LQLHRTYAASFTVKFQDLWRRALTNEEYCLISSTPLALSGMMLEAFERSLTNAKTASDADAEYKFLKSEVERRRNDVLSALEQKANELGVRVEPFLKDNLLIFEEALYATGRL